jgi:4-hydroxy-tetrahydrodipicolinate synthase
VFYRVGAARRICRVGGWPDAMDALGDARYPAGLRWPLQLRPVARFYLRQSSANLPECPREGAMFKGSLVALITPMREDGAVDEKAYASFVDWQIKEGTHGVVPVGTTGESPTLSHAEHKRVVEIAVEVAKGRVPVIAGAGSNSTEEAIDLAKHAKEAGADAILVVTPYYNKPTQEGMFLHFTAIADAVDIPMIIYNIPPRSVVDMSVETMARLAKHKNIIGVKDATANLTRPLHTRRACGPEFCQLSGEDHTAIAFNAAGGVGCISVSANVAPRLCSEMQTAWMEGRVSDAMVIQHRLTPLHDAMFAETSPGPVKYAASLLGKTSERCRLPLAPLMAPTREKVRAAMTEVGLLN